MIQALTPARVPPPGRILSRELEARGWTQKDLAEITGRPIQTINEIVQAKKQITPDTALDLGEAFGTSAEFWTNLETKYRLYLARKDDREREIARKSQLYSLAPISELIKRDWIQATDSLDDLERQVCKFFGIDSIDRPPKLAINFRCSQERSPEAIAQLAWAKQVENLAKQQTVGNFDRKRLQAAIPKILACAEHPEDLAKVPDLLRSLGIYFVIVPHLSKTYLDGAAFYLAKHPVIALTLRYDRIDSFWFTLMHELGHIVAGHQGSYLDDLGNLAPTDEETEANQLAANWLIDPLAFQDFVRKNQPRFSRRVIEQFAHSQKRHPGIILGRLHNDQLVPHKNLRALLVKISLLLVAIDGIP
ncbi:HigA family addiction module antitoxin [Pseudanabaena sp. PCC 6802]|uniref:HigA family addiction module antitoxin n=1 Tax=Pseudanabaena sp. PCC 6802 TaxID=118173 RepID=UPI00034717A0|nr:HigA family addiction module antitoxin [Pseudanabaena sp. PCC 6802]